MRQWHPSESIFAGGYKKGVICLGWRCNAVIQNRQFMAIQGSSKLFTDCQFELLFKQIDPPEGMNWDAGHEQSEAHKYTADSQGFCVEQLGNPQETCREGASPSLCFLPSTSFSVKVPPSLSVLTPYLLIFSYPLLPHPLPVISFFSPLLLAVFSHPHFLPYSMYVCLSTLNPSSSQCPSSPLLPLSLTHTVSSFPQTTHLLSVSPPQTISPPPHSGSHGGCNSKAMVVGIPSFPPLLSFAQL